MSEYNRPASRRVLLAGVSASALSVGLLATPAAAAPPAAFSPAWFAARVDGSTAGAAPGSQAGTLNQITTAQRNLTLLTARLQQLQTAETAAAKAASAAATLNPGVNGLVMGGLAPATATINGAAPEWVGANQPLASQNGANFAVVVKQTQAQAVLTWQNFNVGSKTSLTFDQTGGGSAASSWVVLNRVEDTAPSQILGSINAVGKVYVINANGLLFGGGAVVNVNSLIASTAAITDAQFTTAGIYGPQSGSSFAPSFTGATPSSFVTVAQGAQITTAAPGSITSGGGYVMLLGGAVENDGVITTDTGQTVLAAGKDFSLRPGYSTSTNQTATTLGSQVGVSGVAGTVVNNGLIQSPHGDITLVGQNVTQNGVALSTTSVNTRGTVHLLNPLTTPSNTPDTGGSITLGATSVTSVEPDGSSTTALDSQRSSLITASAVANALRLPASAANPQLNDVGLLADRLDESRVEVTTGGVVAFDGGSLTMSQGGQIAVSAGERAWVGDGAELDVSGATGAVLPMSSNQLTVNIQGNELRDAPVNRDTGLITSNNVTVDINGLVEVAPTTPGGNPRYYTQGGLLEVGGYLSNTGHTIDEWAAPGGTITLAASQLVAQPAAELNVAGGSVSVQAGYLGQSYLIGQDGNLYNVNTAPANLSYVGVYGGFTEDNAHWGINLTFNNALGNPSQIYQAGYSYGRDAGQVVLTAETALVEAKIDAGVSNGVLQTGVRPAGVTDGYSLPQATVALPGSLTVGGFDASNALLTPDVTINDSFVPVAGSVGPTTMLPPGLDRTANFSASQLSSEGLGGLTITTGGTISLNAPLTLAPGGSISLSAANVAVGGQLTEHGGSVTVADLATDNTGLIKPLLPAAGGGVQIAAGTTIDLSGQYTNAITSPGNEAGEAVINGGSLRIDSIRNLLVDAGTIIDTSSGGALLPGGKQVGGTGGSVSLIGDDPRYNANAAPVTLGATFRDYGVNGGGTLSLSLPKILIGAAGTVPMAPAMLITPDLFSDGFSKYVIDGQKGLDVAQGTFIKATVPVYAFYGNGSTDPASAPTGASPDSVFAVILPPMVYTADPATARLTQRQGASLAFISSNTVGGNLLSGGSIDLGAGSSIAVDPGQSVQIQAYDQITDDAAISAPGGSVLVVNTRLNLLQTPNSAPQGLALSIYLGGDSSINVNGIATTARDEFGRPYGVVTAGGTITIGGPGGLDSNNALTTTDALVIVRPGAKLSASGASAAIDLLAGSIPGLSAQATAATSLPVLSATSGGMINLSSDAGIYLDGTATAAPGGAGAVGGTLAITLETPVFGFGAVVPNQLIAPREINISNLHESSLGTLALQAGQPIAPGAFGQADISQQQIADGGFNAVDLSARDALVFQGSVSLSAPGSIVLAQGDITDANAAGAVTIDAPYVSLSGGTELGNIDQAVVDSINARSIQWTPYNGATQATFAINSRLLDISNNVRFGVSATLPVTGSNGPRTMAVDLPGFADITLGSLGPIRFANSSLVTPGNLNFIASQVYPDTGAQATVFAGYDQYAKHITNLFVPTGTITISRPSGALTDPSVPYSVGGSLALYAGAIVQGGVIRAPEGNLSLGAVGIGPPQSGSNLFFAAYTYSVAFEPGSMTSVSLDGTTVPYGGTVDGVTYLYNGTNVGTFDPAITVSSQTQTIAKGAILDLSGGGTLAGAGFVSGRGGSVNVLTNPFVVFTAGSGKVVTPTLAQDPVFAIVPGYVSSYAPTSPLEASGANGSVPLVGSQITIGAGVPGIAPGTYTLLPSYYATLPNAARVQIDTATLAPNQGVTALGAGSYLLNAHTSVAHTGLAPQVPVAVIVTTSAGVAAHSQFDTLSYSAFELEQSAQYGVLRPALPEDAKTLNLVYPQAASDATALKNAGFTLFAPVATYNGGTLNIEGAGLLPSLEITPDGATPTPKYDSIEASAIDAFGAARLVVGGHLQPSVANPNEEDVLANVFAVAVRDGAVLSAPEIFLTANTEQFREPVAGSITIESGATVSTIGQGAPPFDSSNGYFYNSQGYTTVALSNGSLIFSPANIGAGVGSGPITVDPDAKLLAGGTLAFDSAETVTLDVAAIYGARTLSIGVQNVNILSDLAVTENADNTLILPSGLELTQGVLSRLLGGDPALGVAALQNLILTASSSVNFAGSVDLNTIDQQTGLSTLQSFTLNTPAIYGYGGPSDVASLTTGTLYWNGVEIPAANISSLPVSAPPGAAITNGPGTGTGVFNIVAQNIVLGYGPNALADNQTTLNRLIEGFATVNLTASQSISGNNRGTLAFYEQQGTITGAAGMAAR